MQNTVSRKLHAGALHLLRNRVQNVSSIETKGCGVRDQDTDIGDGGDLRHVVFMRGLDLITCFVSHDI